MLYLKEVHYHAKRNKIRRGPASYTGILKRKRIQQRDVASVPKIFNILNLLAQSKGIEYSDV
jgi:hypothetical protein